MGELAGYVGAGFWFLLLLAVGCRPLPHRPPETGHLEAEWSGADQGKISAPATAEWCGAKRLLEIRAIQGDTGIALAVYLKDTLTGGRYRVVDPPKAESLPPAAAVALRWFTQNAVKGFQGNTGTVILERSQSGELGGNLVAGTRSVTDTERVAVKGTFEGLVVRRSPGCDTVVH
jgi:hypothetical protein